MATIETGSIVSDIRGSVGNETYSRNRGGLYAKSRTIPTQPASAYRDTAQAALTSLTQAWSGTLTEVERKTWRQYSKTWTSPNRLGQPIHTSAICHFVRTNFRHYVVYSAILHTTAPPGGPCAIPQFTFTAITYLNRVTMTYPLLNYPTPVTGMRIFWYAGHSINPGRNYYSTPWRFLGLNTVVAGSWYYDPWIMTCPWTLAAGDKIFTKLVATLPTGETSGPFQCSTIIT